MTTTERIEAIYKNRRWFRPYDWEVWFRGPSGGGPVVKGTAWTLRRAERRCAEATR